MLAALKRRTILFAVLVSSWLPIECFGISTKAASSSGTFIHLIDRRGGRRIAPTANAAPSICSRARQSGSCREKVQRFYFDGATGGCVGFVYSGCGGNENRFETRQHCEERCMDDMKISPCANGYAHSSTNLTSGNDLSCASTPCHDGFICITDESSTSLCCNQTIEDSYVEARSSFCARGRRAMRSVDHSEVLFARSCDDLVCANGFECVQLNTIFAKCCQRNNLDQISIAMQTLTLVNEKDTRSSLIARGQIKRQSPLNGSKNFTSPCTMPKDEGHCNSGPIRIVQFFYYDPEWQSCFAFKYVGCGGNANRFVTRDDCESKCLYADGSVCKGPLVPVEPFTQTPPCTDSICPQGYTCSYGFGFMECCNSTIQQFVIDAYSSTCPDGSPAGGINEDHFIATFAKTCSNLICDAGQRCVQVSQYFAKCCGLIPPVQPPPLPVVENGHKGYGSPADEPPASFSSYYTGPKSNMPDGATDAGSLPYST